MKYFIALTAFIISVSSVYAGEAEEIIKASGLKGGLLVHAGQSATLTADLYANDKFLVHGLRTDEANLEKARESVTSRGRYGNVTVDLWDGKRFPYIDNLVNLIVVSDSGAQVSGKEVLRVLVPNGTAIIKEEGNKELLSTVGQEPKKIGDGYVKITKPVPPEIDEWTHWLYGPGNNAVSSDKRVGVSRNMQWITDPLWGRSHNLVPSMSVMVTANGRIYYIIDEAPISMKGPTDNWALVCRDAFNGLELWKKPIPNWGWKKWSSIEFGGVMRFKRPDQLFRRLIAIGDTVYVTLGFNEPVVAIEGSTGTITKVYEGTENTSAIFFKNDTLFLTKNVLGENPGKDILAIEAETGKKQWERKGYKGITSRGDELKAFMDAYLTIGDKSVFFLNEEEVVALDMKTGKELWTAPRPEMQKNLLGANAFRFRNFCSLVFHGGKVFLGQLVPKNANLNKWQEKDMAVLALDAGTGKKLWQYMGMSLAHFTPPDLFVNNGMVWTMRKDVVSLLGLDVETGEVKKEYPVKDMQVGHHHRCYRNKATENLYLAGEEGIEYINFENGELDVHHWIRGACAFGILPANGLIYLPTHACGCHGNSMLNGFIALASNPYPAPDTNVPRLQKGGAYGADSSGKAGDNKSSWPAYKHDNARSNCTVSELPNEIKQKWIAPVGKNISAPVIAGGNVYIADKDSCRVICLDADSGKEVWQFFADGPVDTPPTFHKGNVVFGSRGGSVYSLKADNGELAWRFLAAPSAAKLLAFGRLESVWPVIGSVLIMNDKVYCVAGRSMNLNGGMYSFELDVNTGEILKESRLEADIESKGEIKDLMLPDILVSDGKNVYMRKMLLASDPADEKPKKGKGKGRASSQLTPNDGGLLDGTWFNSNFWKYQKAAAQMLIFDDDTAYCIKAQNKLKSKSFSHDIFKLGSGYEIFAISLRPESGKDEKAKEITKVKVKVKGKGKKKKKERKMASGRKWENRIKVRAQAMVVTGKHLCLAGSPDVVDMKDPWSVVEDRKGGMLEIYTKSDGKKTAEYKLESTPIYDGMAAADGNLYISLKNGSIVCYGK